MQTATPHKAPVTPQLTEPPATAVRHVLIDDTQNVATRKGQLVRARGYVIM